MKIKKQQTFNDQINKNNKIDFYYIKLKLKLTEMLSNQNSV